MARKNAPGNWTTRAEDSVFKIPKQGKDGTWYPIVRVGRHVPFGYEQDPEDDMILQPIPEELELLDQAKLYLKEYSLRAVANWLSNKSGRYISHVGLAKRVSIEEYRRKSASSQRAYQRKAEEAAKKAEKLERDRLGGSRTREYYGDDSSDS